MTRTSVHFRGGTRTALCRRECSCISRVFAQQTREQKWWLKICCRSEQTLRIIPWDAGEGCRCTWGKNQKKKTCGTCKCTASHVHNKHRPSVQHHRDHFFATQLGSLSKFCSQQLRNGHNAALMKHIGTWPAQAVVVTNDVPPLLFRCCRNVVIRGCESKRAAAQAAMLSAHGLLKVQIWCTCGHT